MARLPQPGSDDGVWGEILNDFLSAAHNSDGTLKDVGVVADKAPITRSITTGAGLSGGGDLSADRTLSVADDSTTQRVEVARNGVLSGARKRLNFIQGNNVTLTAADDAANNRVNLTIASSGSIGYINVKDHGAVGDGIAMDTAAIQAAINAAPATGAVIYLPPGNYRINAAISLRPNITVMGAGQYASQITQTSTTAHGLSAISSDSRHIRIQGLRITGPNSGSGNGIHHDRSSSWGMWNWEMSDVLIEYFGGHGFVADTPILSRFSNVHVAYCGLNGFNIIGSGGATGTSTAFISCWAQRCVQAGYYMENLVYSSFVSCATDFCGIGYHVDGAVGVAFTGCGAENPEDKGTGIYTGVGFLIDGCFNISLYTPTTYMVQDIGYLVTGFSHRITLHEPREYGAAGGTYAMQVDNGAFAHVMSPNFTLGTNFIGAVYQVDHTGEIRWRGDTTLNRSSAGVVAVSKQLRANTDGTVPGLYSVASADGNVSLGVLALEAATANKRLADLRVTGDTNPRVRFNSASALGPGGSMTLTDGASNSANVYQHSGILKTDNDFALNTLGRSFRVKEGTNAKMGTATLVAGVATVATTAVAATSRVFLSIQTAGGTPGALYVANRVNGTSFEIRSAAGAADTSTVAWIIFDPA